MDGLTSKSRCFYFVAEESADMPKSIRCFAVVMMVLLATMIFPGLAPAQEAKFDSDTISGLGARNIGSATMSERVAAIAAVKEDGRLTVYLGAASGGVWNSAKGGTAVKPVFDKEAAQSIGAVAIDPQAPKTIWAGTGEAWTRNSVSIGNGIYKSTDVGDKEAAQSIGAVAIDPQAPKTIWAGTGEAWTRNSVSIGNGIYKSTDGGDSWTNMGLKNSERIARIIVDPKNSSTVYACVPGKLWSDSEDRGVYKTTDGGKSWSKILKGANLSTGCSMISMNSQDPKVLFAGMWDFRRKGWTFSSEEEKSAPQCPRSLFCRLQL